MLLKFITIFNWLVVAFLTYAVVAATFFPAKDGDSTSRGIGKDLNYLAAIVLATLIVLNLLPYEVSKYAAFGLLAVPFLLFQIAPVWRSLKKNIGNMIEVSKPIFEDKQLDRIAQAIQNGEPEKVSRLLQEPVARLNEGGELLAFAIGEASSSSYKPTEKLECVRLLFQAGARLDSITGLDVPIHMGVGRADLLRLLLEHGADPNAVQVHFKRHILFESMDTHQEPEASVRALLDFGADPNALSVMDDRVGPVSPLFHAAWLGRWGVCAALLEHGADPEFQVTPHTSFRNVVQKAEQGFSENGYSTKADFERMRKTLSEAAPPPK